MLWLICMIYDPEYKYIQLSIIYLIVSRSRHNPPLPGIVVFQDDSHGARN